MSSIAPIAELQRSLGRVEGKLDALIAAATAHTASNEKRHGDTEGRLRKVEGAQRWWAGAAAMIGAFLGIGAHKISAG